MKGCACDNLERRFSSHFPMFRESFFSATSLACVSRAYENVSTSNDVICERGSERLALRSRDSRAIIIVVVVVVRVTAINRALIFVLIQ